MSRLQQDQTSACFNAAAHAIERTLPAANFFEGALLGNGGLGAVVCIRPDAVQVHFGHNNVWDIRLAENHKDEIGTFREVLDKIKAIPDTVAKLTDDAWYSKYLAITRDNYAKPYPRPFPCGTLILGFDRREAESLGYRLDIATGLCAVRFLVAGKPQTLQVFTAMESDRLFLRMVDGGNKPIAGPFNRIRLLPDPETPRDIPPFTPLEDGSGNTLSFLQVLPFQPPADQGNNPQAEQAARHPKDRAFRLTARVAAHLGQWRWPSVRTGMPQEMERLERGIQPAGPFAAVVQLDQGLASELSGTAPDLSEPDLPLFEHAQQRSQRSWQTFWERSGVALGDELLEQVWYRNLYFLNCSVRPGVTCPGLFANWSYRNIGTAWHGDYHMDYNAQQPFWVTFSSNHADKHLPYVAMIEHLLPVCRAWARDYFGMRGASFPVSAYPVEMTTSPYPIPTWGLMTSVTPWAVQSLWWHYLYTQDRDFLERRAFTPIRDAVLFLVDFMTRPEAHGAQWGDDLYHIVPAVPPELYGLAPGYWKHSDDLVSLTLIKFVFNAFLDACRVLRRDGDERELLAQVRTILDHFPEYPTAGSPRGKVFVSLKGEDPDMVYNCPVSTMAVFPGEEYGLHSPPAQYAIAANSYRQQQNEGGTELVFLNLQAARLGLLDLERFKRQIRYCLQPNGTCADMALQVHGRYDDSRAFDYMSRNGVWFENFALPVVINECLMQSYNGAIRLFPNWPKERRAEFRTLRAVGAFLVSAACADGAVQWVQVRSEAGGRLRLVNPWRGAVNCIIDGKSITCEGELLTFETQAGQTLQLMRKEKI